MWGGEGRGGLGGVGRGALACAAPFQEAGVPERRDDGARAGGATSHALLFFIERKLMYRARSDASVGAGTCSGRRGPSAPTSAWPCALVSSGCVTWGPAR